MLVTKVYHVGKVERYPKLTTVVRGSISMYCTGTGIRCADRTVRATVYARICALFPRISLRSEIVRISVKAMIIN